MTNFEKFLGLDPERDDTMSLLGADTFALSRKRDYSRYGRKREFISWDGEGAGDGATGPQNYCLMGNSKGGILRTDTGYLSSLDMFAFLTSQSVLHPTAFHVAYGFNYDVNMILRDVPYPVLKRIHKDNVAYWRGYRIEWFPTKWFMVSHRATGASIRIYDTIGFWHTRLDKALENDPILRNDPRLALIKAGKQGRGTFTYDELDSRVIPYFQAEMELHAALCEQLRVTLEQVTLPAGGETVSLVPNEWYGPSAIIKTHYAQAGLKRAMNRPVSDLTRPRRFKRGRPQVPDKRMTYTLPDAVNDAARASFAGGRFEQFKIGVHDGPVYGYDITSAYPHAMTTLPQLRDGEWSHHTADDLAIMRKTQSHPGWGFYWIYWDTKRTRDAGYHLWRNSRPEEPPSPLFCRDEWGTVSYPPFTAGWYPSHSTDLVWGIPGAEITQAWVWHPDPASPLPRHPFADDSMVNLLNMYDMKERYEREERADLRYAVKITLNSGYGKTAQKRGVGLGDNLPAFHQIEWASHITDHCRAKIYRAAINAWQMDALISIETDAIYTTKRIPYLDAQMDGKLGGFTCDEYTGIAYLQSGIYFTQKDGAWSFHNRGLNKDSVTIDDVRDHLASVSFHADKWESMHGALTNFTGLGQAGISVVKHPTQFYQKWLRWPTVDKEIRLGNPRMKRAHAPANCRACIEGMSPDKELHDLVVPRSKSGVSVPKQYPWIPVSNDVEFADSESRWS